LRKQVIDETVQVMGIVAVTVNGGLDEFKKWRVPPRDPDGGIQRDRPRRIGNVKNSRESITYRTDQ
jgi:hypothetical protein